MIAELIDDIRWAIVALRARRYRRGLEFATRLLFDSGIRPIITAQDSDVYPGERQVGVIDYPDALYHVKRIDLARAQSCCEEWELQEAEKL